MQLRQDNLAGDHWSLVGFQTQLKWGEQARVLRMIPGLEQAEFVRFGMVHRNTYINGPTVLQETWQTRARADLFFAGQVSGVEGYVESAASGPAGRPQRRRAGPWRAADDAAAHDRHRRAGVLRVARRGKVLPAEQHHLRHHGAARGRPGGGAPKGADRKRATSERALADLETSDGTRCGGSRPVSAAAAAEETHDGSLKQYIRDFVEYLRLNRNVSAHTVRAYESDLAQFLTSSAAAQQRPRPSLTPADFSPDNVRLFLGAVFRDGASRAPPRASWRRCARSRAGCVGRA